MTSCEGYAVSGTKSIIALAVLMVVMRAALARADADIGQSRSAEGLVIASGSLAPDRALECEPTELESAALPPGARLLPLDGGGLGATATAGWPRIDVLSTADLADVRGSDARNGNVEVYQLPATPGSHALFLTALLGASVWQGLRKTRQAHWGHLPDWYHAEGPTQVGRSIAFDPSCVSEWLSVPLFDGTAGMVHSPGPHRRGQDNSEDTPISWSGQAPVRPRAPPFAPTA
ncbi:MAG: hypothetical protein AMXMBFR83_13160 [Phycisphaerae bacterium]